MTQANLFAGAPMKAVSLWQPWASLCAVGVKRHETRSWSTPYRGLIAIHAAKTIDRVGAPAGLCARAFGAGWWSDLPAGAVVAVAYLADVLPTHKVRAGLTEPDAAAGNFDAGRFAWRLDSVRPLIDPIPAIGRQGLFNWTPPVDLEANLGAVVDHFDRVVRLGLVERGAA